MKNIILLIVFILLSSCGSKELPSKVVYDTVICENRIFEGVQLARVGKYGTFIRTKEIEAYYSPAIRCAIIKRRIYSK